MSKAKPNDQPSLRERVAADARRRIAAGAQEWTLSDVLDALDALEGGLGARKSLATELARLTQRGGIRRIRQGVYGPPDIVTQVGSRRDVMWRYARISREFTAADLARAGGVSLYGAETYLRELEKAGCAIRIEEKGLIIGWKVAPGQTSLNNPIDRRRQKADVGAAVPARPLGEETDNGDQETDVGATVPGRPSNDGTPRTASPTGHPSEGGEWEGKSPIRPIKKIGGPVLADRHYATRSDAGGGLYHIRIPDPEIMGEVEALAWADACFDYIKRFARLGRG